MKAFWYTPSERHSLKKAVCKGRIKRVREIISSGSLYYAQEWSDAADGYILLCTAVKEKHTEIAKLLLANGSKVNNENEDPSETPLHFAVRNGDIEIVHMLLHKGANVNAEAKDGTTSLHIALETRNLQIAEHLLDCGANVNAPCSSESEDGYTELHLAVKNDREKAMKLLLSRGANVNAAGRDGTTPLHIALKKHHLGMAEELLKHGANIDALNYSESYDGYTPLHLAAKNGSKKMINWLLSKGANVSAEGKYGKTSLHIALIVRQFEIAKHLIKCGANVDAAGNTGGFEDGYTPLHLAAKEGKKKIITLLLLKGANVNAEAKKGTTPLHVALKEKEFEIAEQLINCGANVNAVSNSFGIGDGYTPLHLVANCSEEMVKLLLRRGANVNAQTKDGTTPLHIALIHSRFGIVEHLLKCGANVNAVYSTEGQKDYTSLHLAAQTGSVDVIKLLLKFGAKVDSTITHGVRTPLITAVKYGCYNIVKFLLKLGANIHSTDEYGETALHSAAMTNDKEMVTFLLDHGSDITIMNKKNYTVLDCTMLAYKERLDFSLHPHAYLIGDDFLHENDDNLSYVNVIKMLKRHMVKIKAANLYAVNKDILFRKDILSIPSPAFDSYNDELSDFQNECEKEIARMKSEVINDKITFYNILTRSVRQVAMYATNDSIVEAFGSYNYKIKFPIYAGMISSNFRKGQKEKEFMEKGDKILRFLFNNNFPSLPRECIEKILSYLNYEDLL